MEIKKTPLEGVLELYPRVFEDARGYFFESFRKEHLLHHGITVDWVQENESFSQKGTLRGLHFQHHPYAQAKLVRVVTGKVLDVIVDLRKHSATYGQHHAVVLDAAMHNLMFIPAGFAHGFSVLEDAIFMYKCSNYYTPKAEGGILWNDPELGIDWQVENPILSERDRLWPDLHTFTAKSEGGLYV
ncbi:dTDP-4-dehydrorhamnose 3,5-epimerase [Nitritalea halalkaliphila LW7]|uniref:dTDP-4-dehydrorhamnose 3,5-epimerase n=1 Tax=Nitritalea halalkaliphila LW7 TaxID=1189621 RepID=I5C5R6_9BACT|nr:dTDP-4-dehydrorhamnose 3,5-epimerase [Nitritalea halalkaliphila]EIM77168.1 dTDP-4-dehydrorhamnose 3,5-epimerase [Nitritalea halalkaliphila LW7]